MLPVDQRRDTLFIPPQSHDVLNDQLVEEDPGSVQNGVSYLKPL